METVDYESLETLLGQQLRQSDNYDLDQEHFFPIGFLDRLTHFSQNLSVVENRHDDKIELNYHGDDFDRWVDNMVSATHVYLKPDGAEEVCDTCLSDILEITLNSDKTVSATLFDETSASAVNSDGSPLTADNVESLCLAIDLDYGRQSSPLKSLEYLASLFYRAGRSMKMNICNSNRDRFIDPIFNFFKFDMVRLVPELLGDLEQIYDEQLLNLTLTAKGQK